MGKFKTYRYLVLKDESSLRPAVTSRIISQPRGLRKIILLTLLLGIVVTFLLGFWSGESLVLDTIAKTFGYQGENHYAVIIDAGSSGTRVLAYRFRVPFALYGEPNLQLEEEFFEQSKPGLSSFADDPKSGAQSIVKLIESAEFLIPKARRRDTPLLVRATAGLRLLPADKSDVLIQHVKTAIGTLGYSVAEDSVEVMNGSDEGIFIWYTLNLLFGNLHGKSAQTMAALDLGGGSTQITFQHDNLEELSVPNEDQFTVPAGDHNMTVFTHSYLNLGLLAARYGVFKLEAGKTDKQNITSVCVDPLVQGEPWVYANKQYYISGAKRHKQTSAEAACHAIVKRYVMETLDWEPKASPRGDVAAMSYFYDVAADAGIIDIAKGGTITVNDYKSSAKTACTNQNIDQPFACIDLVFISTLLNDAYKISMDKPISLHKKVDGHEVSWALGLAYTTVIDKLATKKLSI